MPITAPFLADVQQTRRAVQKHALPSRAEDKTAARAEDARLLAIWRRAVWTRDKGLCQRCGVKVLKTIALDLKRGEVHHRKPRSTSPALKYAVANGVLLCRQCHEKTTRRLA